MARRQRCKGECGELKEREELSELPGVGLVCEDCMAKAADEVAVEQGAIEQLSQQDEELSDALFDAAPGELVTTGVGEWSTPPAGGYPTTSVDLGRPPMQPLPKKPNRWRDLPNVDVPGWPLRYGRVSASALATFMRCPEQFRLQNVLGMQRPESGATITGKAVHEAMETHWARLIHQGVSASKTEVRDAYHDSFDRQADKYGDDVDWAARRGDRDNAAKWRNAGASVVREYHAGLAQTVTPVAYEDMFAIDLPGVPVPLVGYLDLVATDRIWDVKVGGRAHTKPTSDWRLQGMIYPLSPYRLPMGWHSLAWPDKQGDVKANPVTAPLTASTYTAAVNLTRALVRGILAYTAAFGVDVPWPGQVNHTWACDSCEYREQGACEWWHPRIDVI